MKHLKYLIHSFDFEKQEDHILHRRDILILFVKVLLSKDKKREAYTIIKRHSLEDEFKEDEEVQAIIAD